MIAIFDEINLTQYRIFGRNSENFGSGKKSLIQNILQGAKSTIPGTEMGQISIVTRAHNLTQYRRNSGNLTQSGQIMRSLGIYSMHLSMVLLVVRVPAGYAGTATRVLNI
jgi:hypothetical protein